MPNVPKNFLPPILSSLAQPVPRNFRTYSCPRVKEMVGKEHRYRHYSFQNWLKLQETEGKTVDETDDDEEVPDMVDKESDPFMNVTEIPKAVAEKRKIDDSGNVQSQKPKPDDGSAKRQKLSDSSEVRSKGTSRSRKRKIDESDAMDETGNGTRLPTQAKAVLAPSLKPAETETTGRSPKRGPKATTNTEAQNTTTLKRMQILLTILERDKVRELNNILMDDFTKMELNGQEVQHSVDRRTVSRLGEKLEKEKKARVIKCSIPLLNGSILSKTLLLHSSVSPSDAIVKEYIESLRERNAITGKQFKSSKNEISDMNIENRQSSSITSTNEGSLANHAGQRSTSHSSEHVASWNWRVVAKYYGWISATMLRIKTLHKHMLRMAVHAPYGHTTTSNFKLATAKIITQMTLKMFLQLFGVHERLPLLDAYLKTEANNNVTIGNLPKQLRAELFQGNNKYRRSLGQSINAMRTLHLLKPVEESDSNRLAVNYELQTNVPLRNYRAPGHPITRYVSMETLEDHRQYWEELQFLSTGHTVHVMSSDGSSSNLADAAISKLPDYLTGITSMSSWFMKFNLSRQTREILENHVDRSNRTTPYKDLRACIRIANECGISVQVVREYYKSIEYPYNKMKKMAASRKSDQATISKTDDRTTIVQKLLSSPNIQRDASRKAHFMATGSPVNRSVSRIHNAQDQTKHSRGNAGNNLQYIMSLVTMLCR
jgi:hypothetical protein